MKTQRHIERTRQGRTKVYAEVYLSYFAGVNTRRTPLRKKRAIYGWKQVKIIVEKHPNAYIAYPLGLREVVVGQGDTYEAALTDVKSAIKFHIETFGSEELEVEPPILEAFVAEARIPV